MKKEIGGYLDIDLPLVEEYHNQAIRLNTGRNAFEYILRAKEYKKVYLPYYTCDVMLEPIHKLSLEYQFYSIDTNLIPQFDFDTLEKDSVIVINNYFGICDKLINEVRQKHTNIIVDNCQAFYSSPLPDTDTLYSPRKFFGLPDGAYLYTDKLLDINLKRCQSYDKMEHLLGRIDTNAEQFFSTFRSNDAALEGNPIQEMSKLTQRLLCSINYKDIANQRRENFNYLHSQLSHTNQFKLEIDSHTVPMIYPYLIKNGDELKKKLIETKIFVATYWPNVREWANPDSIEYFLTENLLALPIDQRYGKEEMAFITQTINNYGN